MQTCTQHQAQKNQNYETDFFKKKLRIPQQYWLLFRTEASIYRSLIKHGFLENSPLIAVPIRISISRGFPPFMSHVRLHQKAYAQASSSEGHPRHPGLERVFRLLQEVFFAEASMDKSGARSNFQVGNWAANWAVLFGEISWHGWKSQALHLSSKKKLRRPVFLGAIPTTRLSISHTSCLRMQKSHCIEPAPFEVGLSKLLANSLH